MFGVRAFPQKSPSNGVMMFARTPFRLAAAALLAPLALSAVAASALAQMHKVATPDQVTRAVGVYEFLGDPEHPKAARFIPVSLFIGGHFEDAGVYLARPIPFALETGLRYELQEAGVRKDFYDLVAARDFTNSAVAANLPFDDGWFGYGRVTKPAAAKAGKVRPNCGTAYVVDETGKKIPADDTTKDAAKKDDARPHFGSKSDDSAKAAAAKDPAKPDPCVTTEDDRPEKITLDERKDSNSPDPERPTLHRSPESTANNTGANGKPDKKASKPPTTVVTANGNPGDDPDRPTIRHRSADEDDPNALPPDPLEYAGKEQAKAADAKQAAAPRPAAAAASGVPSSGTVADDVTINAGNTMGGGPKLTRGRPTAPPPDAPASPTRSASGIVLKPVSTPATAQVLDTIVAVSDAKDRPAHDYSYKFASSTERAAVTQRLEEMAQEVLASPWLATDAPSSAKAAATSPAPAATPAKATAVKGTTAAARARAARAAKTPAAPAKPVLADEELNAYQLYYSAPISYVLTARVAATDTTPERYVIVIATTDAENRINVAFRSVTDALHLDRTPRYRLIDVVDADATNRASFLMELRGQRSRQFALYRLLGNRPDQMFVSGSTLL